MTAKWPYVEQGRGTYGDYRVKFWAGDPESWLRIGNYTSIAEGVEFIMGGGHRPDWASNYPFRLNFQLPGRLMDGLPRSKGDIVIGSDVWIGRGATVMSGVTVGHGAVIGAHAVVAKNVRPYSIVVGNPCREVSLRFDEESVRALLALEWWNWPEQELLSIVHLLNGEDVGALIAYGQVREFASPEAQRGL